MAVCRSVLLRVRIESQSPSNRPNLEHFKSFKFDAIAAWQLEGDRLERLKETVRYVPLVPLHKSKRNSKCLGSRQLENVLARKLRITLYDSHNHAIVLNRNSPLKLLLILLWPGRLLKVNFTYNCNHRLPTLQETPRDSRRLCSFSQRLLARNKCLKFCFA